MANFDVNSLSYAEMVALKSRLDKQIEEKRGEELKVLADGFAKKLQQAGFSVSEGIDSLRPYVETKAFNKADTSKPVAALYRDPANPGNTWSGRGRAAGWLAAYEAAGRSRDEFKVSAT